MTPIERDNQAKLIKDVVGKIDPNLKEYKNSLKIISIRVLLK